MNIIKHTQLQEPPVEIGQFYCDKSGETYLIAKSGCDQYRIINIETGERWDDSTLSLEDVSFKIRKYNFTLITKPFTVTPNV